MSSVGWPQRDDVGTDVIASNAHSWFVPGPLRGPFGGIRTFRVERPVLPIVIRFATLDYGIIFPTWWLVTVLALPAAVWLAVAAIRRRKIRNPGFPIEPIADERSNK